MIFEISHFFRALESLETPQRRLKVVQLLSDFFQQGVFLNTFIIKVYHWLGQVWEGMGSERYVGICFHMGHH